ncbi:MAG: alpha-glucosidase [Eubacteriales bacterium]|nr:alpha-glucosidase [Eubacteriales bacterium]
MDLIKAWWKEAVVYQIYPKSFCDSNGDGIGDLNGITSKLEYLADLGINVIWLSPIYKSPNVDNGYDIADYEAIMDSFGTMEDFDRMLEKAHSLGIKIMMDLVVNHTSDQHRWFQESKKGPDNPYRDYYIWKKPVEGRKYPNNWGASFGAGSVWEWDEPSQMYYLHLFAKEMPDLNWANPKVHEEVFGMMRRWLEKGVDGFRMDVINLISKDPTFPDGELLNHEYSDFYPVVTNHPEVHTYLREMYNKVLKDYDTITVGECCCTSPEVAKIYTSETERELNMIFQFDHMGVDNGPHGRWCDRRMDLRDLKAAMSKWQDELYGQGWNSLYWNNHDQPRCVSRFGNDSDEYREISAKMLGTCLHMMQGTPYVYQGEELGMTNICLDINEYEDIETLDTYYQYVTVEGMDPEEMMRYIHYKSRDNARTGMQWSAEKNGGFTSGTPWFTVNPNYTKINAASQVNDPNSVFSYYKKLIHLRKENPVMVYGKYELLLPEDEDLYVYTRTDDDTQLYVLCNFTDKERTLAIPDAFRDTEVLIANYDAPNADGTIRPYEAFVLKRSL